MNYLSTLLATTAVLTWACVATAADESSSVEYKKNGGYQSDSESSARSASGTKHTTSRKIDVDVKDNGMVDSSTRTDASSDPKGLMNEREDTSKTTYEDKKRGGYKKTSSKKHHESDGTDTSVKNTTDVDVDTQGNTTERVKTEHVVDPKGMMNKTSTTTRSKSVNGAVTEKE